jgi:hypothetical protein
VKIVDEETQAEKGHPAELQLEERDNLLKSAASSNSKVWHLVGVAESGASSSQNKSRICVQATNLYGKITKCFEYEVLKKLVVNTAKDITAVVGDSVNEKFETYGYDDVNSFNYSITAYSGTDPKYTRCSSTDELSNAHNWGKTNL